MIHLKSLLISFIILTTVSCRNKIEKDTPPKINNETKFSLSTIKDGLKPNKQNFFWNSFKDTVIECEQGTKIYLPKYCLDTTLYNPEIPVKIQISEYYKLSEFISENITTRSTNGILETGGMVNINIFQNNKVLKIDSNKMYAILFPKPIGENKDMTTFYGAKNENNNVIWNVNNNLSNEKISYKTLTYCDFMLDSRISKIGDEKVVWKTRKTNKYVPDFIVQNLNPSEEMKNDFCQLSLKPKYGIQYDKNGYVKNIKVNKSATKKYDEIICDFIKKMPPVNMDSMPKKYTNYYYTVGFKGWQRSTYTKDEFNKKFESKYNQFKNKVISKINKADLNYYIISASKLNWINCDRFWDTKSEKTNFYVDAKNFNDLKLNLVFSEIKSILPAYKSNGKYFFENVPINKKVKIVGIAYNNNSPLLCTQYTTINNDTLHLNNFESFSLAQLQEKLNSL